MWFFVAISRRGARPATARPGPGRGRVLVLGPAPQAPQADAGSAPRAPRPLPPAAAPAPAGAAPPGARLVARPGAVRRRCAASTPRTSATRWRCCGCRRCRTSRCRAPAASSTRSPRPRPWRPTRSRRRRHAAAFVAAVERAERAWRAARDAAERIRLSNLTPEERSAVERVIKLLTTARDSDNDAERLAAYARARNELARLDRAGVIHMPRTAQAALDVAGRGQLPA